MSSDIGLRQTQIREGTRGEGGNTNRRGEIAAKGRRNAEAFSKIVPVHFLVRRGATLLVRESSMCRRRNQAANNMGEMEGGRTEALDAQCAYH